MRDEEREASEGPTGNLSLALSFSGLNMSRLSLSLAPTPNVELFALP